jgi:hypothetical protein
VRAQAQKILSTPALLPTVNRAAYERMLSAFIVVANLLQPGPGYGTTEVPRTFRTVHPLGWAIWKGEIVAPTEEELLTRIQG